MLLSRVADALYWISRYLERAEHTARLLDVAADLRLGRASTTGAGAIERLYATLGLAATDPADAVAVLDAALLDLSNRSSIASCVQAARENGRQVRDEISSDMWEQLNALYLRVRQMRDEGQTSGRTHYVSRTIIEGIHLFEGVTDATMSHGEGWQYLQAGRFLERADATAALLDAFFRDEADPEGMPPPLDQADWVALLRACSGLEGYCRQNTADVRPERVTDFLLLNAEFPRSIRFAAGRVETALIALGRQGARPRAGRAEQLSGRLRASLDYVQLDEILADGALPYLRGLRRQCGQIHAAIDQSYISYSIEAALQA
jgi:uncharacterized alpha-E superfamily protein